MKLNQINKIQYDCIDKAQIEPKKLIAFYKIYNINIQ